MAPGASTEEKFTFLLSCIRWGNSGVVDFKQVANECGIVSVNAASKRFHRLMKEHGIYQNSSPTGNEGLPVSPKTSRATLTRAPAKSGKKRKLDQSTEPPDETDDEEAEQVKIKSPRKSRKTSGKALGKKEEGIAVDLAGISEGSMLNDSIAVGGFGESEEVLKAAIKAEEHANEV